MESKKRIHITILSGILIFIFLYSLLFQKGIAVPISIAELYFVLTVKYKRIKTPKRSFFLVLFLPISFLILEILNIDIIYVLVFMLSLLAIFIILISYKKYI